MHVKNAEKEQLERNFSLWKAAAYVRLSKEDKKKVESDSIGTQKEIIKEYLKLHPDIELVDFYVDDGFTGTDFDRPGFQSLKEDVISGKVNCVIVKDLSRFARNAAGSGNYIDDFFVQHRVRFISINNGVDTTSGEMNAATQCITVGVTNVLNESVAATTSVNVKGSLNVRRKNGDFIGSFATYGYLKNPEDKHKLIVDEEAAQVVRMIFEKYISGISIYEIAHQLNEMGLPNPSLYKKQKGLNYRHPSKKITDGLWPESSVRRILKNEIYLGNMIQGKNRKLSYKIKKCVAVPKDEWYVVEGTHEAIIDRETFEKAQALFNHNIRRSSEADEFNLFAGFVKCADCGRAMAKKSNDNPNRSYRYYRCETAKKTRRKACTNHTIRIDKMEKAVLVFLQKMVEVATEYDDIIQKINSGAKRKTNKDLLTKALEKQIKNREFLEKIILELYPDFKKGIITAEEYMALKTDTNQKLEKLKEEIEATKEKIKEQENGMENNMFVESFKKLGNIEKLTRPLILELIDEILVHEDARITVRLKCKDAFEQATEYIEMNKDVIRTA